METENKGFKRYLKVLGVLSIIGAIATGLMAALIIFSASFAQEVLDFGSLVISGELALQFIGGLLAAEAVLALLSGISAIRLAGNPSAHGAFYLVVIATALALIGNAFNLANTTTSEVSSLIGTIISVVVNILMIVSAFKVHGESK